jgi:hypothetical protein
MVKKAVTGIQRGQAITFRLPSDTPDHIIKQLQKLKETERRNFSSKIAEFALKGVSKSLLKERETVTIPLPKQLSKEQSNWLRHSNSEALLGSIVYHLLADPIRTTSVLASLNSNAIDINDALYLQETDHDVSEHDTKFKNQEKLDDSEEAPLSNTTDELEDDLMNFDWNKAKQEHASSVEESMEEDQEEDIEDVLGDFIAQMNK